MQNYFIATSNKGKQKEIAKFAKQFGKGVSLVFPDSSNLIDVKESGQTFEENALIKASAYSQEIGNKKLIYVGDDSGITIPALNNEPGVFTRRWAGYEMSDEEILQYCLEKMNGLTGTDREAFFQTVLAVIQPDGAVRYLYGKMRGHILDKPLEGVTSQPGFPFRAIFWVDGIDIPIHQLHSLAEDERKGFLTHRETAFQKLFTNQY